MGCCNKKIKIPKDQQAIVKAINDNRQLRNSSATKSNRSPAGTLAKECPQCKTKTIISVCPVCGFKF